MTSDARMVITALRQSEDRLASIVQSLSPPELKERSYHDWSIAQVMSHLGSQAELFEGWLTSGLEGVEPPGRETMQPVWDAWNARDPEAQASDSLDWNERFIQRLEALSEAELDQFHLSLFGMDLDASAFLRMRLSEHAVHTWELT